MRPRAFVVILIVAELALHFFFPASIIVPAPINLFGITIILVGMMISLSGNVSFIKRDISFTPKRDPKKLVTEGMFSYTRNPMYLAALIILFGLAFFVGSVSAFVSPVLFFIVANFSYIPYEEKLLETIFGEEYGEYKRKVRRWI